MYEEDFEEKVPKFEDDDLDDRVDEWLDLD